MIDTAWLKKRALACSEKRRVVGVERNELLAILAVIDAAREIRDQYLPKDGIELQTFESLWEKLDAALTALESSPAPGGAP